MKVSSPICMVSGGSGCITISDEPVKLNGSMSWRNTESSTKHTIVAACQYILVTQVNVILLTKTPSLALRDEDPTVYEIIRHWAP
jgi:hypothetical protein